MKRVAIWLTVLALLLAVLVVFWSLVPSLWAAEGAAGTTTTLGDAGAAAAAKPKEAALDLGGGVNLEFVWVPGGSFTMGSRASAEDLAKRYGGRYGGKAEDYADEHPAHEVALDGFWMGKYEVTNAQFRRFRPDHNSGSVEGESLNGDSQPVVMVSWENATAFCQWLSGKSGKTIALPSEAQWEYACRAGTTTDRYWGDDDASMGRYANVPDRALMRKWPQVVPAVVEGLGVWADYVIALTEDGYAVTAPVGSYRPNAFGLHDMIGNAYEWCQDWYGGAYYGSSAGRNPTGPETGQWRVVRGGSWDIYPRFCRAADRFRLGPPGTHEFYGFRVVASRTSLSPPTTPTPSPTPTPTLTPRPLPPESAYVENLGGGERLEMVWAPGGRFMMGSANEAGRDIDEGPVHEVTLDGFWMGKFEVMQAQYEAIVGTNPSYFKGPDNPVEMVSWDDATEFCRKLSRRTGRSYGLPSEAQWEYACRADSKTAYCFGDDEGRLGAYAWYDGNSGSQTHPAVGQKRPNAFGLYDMHGNVWEWCQDWYHDSYVSAPTDGSAWLGPASDSRVLRGGSYYIDPGGCRSANRDRDTPGGRSGGSGFRVVASRMN